MNYFRKTVAGVLTASMVLSLCACDDGGTAASSSSVATLPSTTTTTTENDDLVNPVDVTDIDIEPQDFSSVELDTPVLKYLGNYDITTAADIKPAWKLYEQTYASDYYDEATDSYIYPDGAEKPIVCQIVGSAQILETLTARIQADDSPDLVDKQDNTYPYMMSKNAYEDLTPYMDMSSPQWATLQEYVDRYEYNGKHYYYPWSYTVSPQFLFYNRTLFSEYDIPDPAEQWQNDEWTWDAFLSAIQKFVSKSPEERAIGVYGAYLTDNFIASTGTMLIGRDESGKFVNNLKNADVERAATWLETNLRRTGLAMVDYYSEYVNVSEVPVVNGLAAFQAMGTWVFANYCKNYSDSDIFLVPFPRDPNADDYYYRTSTFGYLVPKGAKNVQGACCFINCCRLSLTNEELLETTKTSMMKSKKYSEEEYDFLQQFNYPENFTVVIDENYCFDTDTSAMLQNMLTNIGMDQSDSQESWTQMVESNSPIINAAIDEFNSLVQ
jgi:multiple sugar transport system substrate-binding protein